MTQANQLKRFSRLKDARRKGGHSSLEWLSLCKEYDNKCVRCGASNHKLARDHIMPIYLGGSDLIENIQPLCRFCNSSKGPESYNWKRHRKEKGWDILVPRLTYRGKLPKDDVKDNGASEEGRSSEVESISR